MATVEVVVINWKRPRNVLRIVRRLKEQTHRCVVTVCDSASWWFKLPRRARPLIDNHYVVADCGPFTRYVLADRYRCDFTLFLDDDMLPGRRAVEHFVRWAEAKPEAMLLGQMGRIVGRQYAWTKVPRGVDFTPVDMLVRAQFVRTEQLAGLVRFRQLWNGPIREDDMALAWAIKIFSNGGIFLTPASDDSDEQINAEELPDGHALSKNPSHLQVRTDFWNAAKALAANLGDRRRAA